MYEKIRDQEEEHAEALENHAAGSKDELAKMKARSKDDKKDLLKMLSTKFLQEKKALILEMETEKEKAVLDAESRIRENQIQAISELTTNMNKMCAKKVRDVDKAHRQSCNAQLEEQSDDMTKNFKKENDKREKEWKEEQ
jgi:hypothetical protein